MGKVSGFPKGLIVPLEEHFRAHFQSPERRVELSLRLGRRGQETRTERATKGRGLASRERSIGDSPYTCQPNSSITLQGGAFTHWEPSSQPSSASRQLRTWI
jgi:hypothetical protein